MAINLTSHDIPPGWHLCTLPDFSHIEMGQSPPSSTYNQDGIGLPFFQGKAEFGALYPRIDKHCSEPKKIAKAGATLLSVRAPVGPTNLAKVDCCIGRGLAGIHPLGQIEPKFVLFLLRSVESQIAGEGTGSTFNAINRDFLFSLSFGLPPLAEQHRIVAKIEELFSEVDKGVESLHTAREQLKLYRQAVLKHAFEGKLTRKWREENPDKLETPEELLDRIRVDCQVRHEQKIEEWKVAVEHWISAGKEGKKPPKPTTPREPSFLSSDETADLPELPEGFVYTYLANIGDLGRGKSRHRPRNDPRLFGGPYPFIQTGDVKAANRMVRDYSQTYSEFGLAQSKLWSEGTLCITIAANIAETAFLGFDGCFPDSVVGFTAFDRLVLPEYVELFIKAVRVRIEAYAPATAQKNINLTTLENLVIPLCSIDEQQRLVSDVEAILSTIDQNEAEIVANLSRAEMLRQSILKTAFSGRLVKQDPKEESAAKLLAQIMADKEEQAKIKKAGKKRGKKRSKKRSKKKANRKDAA